jgi:O-antigen/teichoic acid export membrane protein
MSSTELGPELIDEPADVIDGAMASEAEAAQAVEAAQAAAPRRAVAGTFAKRVAGVMATRVTLFGISFLSSVLLSRALGPDGKGAYVAVISLPGMLATLGLFGLPSAINYYAGKGATIQSLIRAMVIFVSIITVIGFVVLWFGLPTFESTIWRAAPTYLVPIALLNVPVWMVVTCGGAILYGRHMVKVYSLIQIWLAAILFAVLVIFVLFLRFGINGAMIGSVSYNVLMMVLVWFAVRRLGSTSPGKEPASLRDIASYGARIAPSLYANYFNYRADTFIIQAQMSDYRYALGQYSMATTMGELVFDIPESIATIFLPRVAGATAEEANQWVGRVGRLTTLLTVGFAVLLIPVAFVGIHLVLPRFGDSLPAFLVLLPAAISMSLAKVLSSFVAGRGRPGLMAFAMVFVLVSNIAGNIILIPMYGIVGASLASVISYTLQAGIVILMTSHLSGQSPLSLFVPGKDEVMLLIGTGQRLYSRVWGMVKSRLLRR